MKPWRIKIAEAIYLRWVGHWPDNTTHKDLALRVMNWAMWVGYRGNWRVDMDNWRATCAAHGIDE